MNAEPKDLNTIPHLAVVFQVPVARMHRIVADHKVAPALILNGVAYYDVAAVTPAVGLDRLEELAPDAVEITTLEPPAEEPIDTEEILKRWPNETQPEPQ